MRFLKRFLFVLYLSLTPVVIAATLPEAEEPVALTLPDCGGDLRAFDDTQKQPVARWPHVVNAARFDNFRIPPKGDPE